MRWLLIALGALAVLVAALVIAPMLIGEKGYVLIAIGDTAIEMTVISLVISIVVALVGWWILKKIFLWVMSLFKGSHRWFGSLGERRRRKAFYRGLQALVEGELSEAKKAFKQTTEGDFDGVNYLAAAQVARALDEKERVRYLLDQAEDYPRSRIAALIVQSRLDMEEGNYQDALNRLNSVEEKDAEHRQIVKLKAECLARQGHWQELQNNLGNWKKLLDRDDFVRWSQRIAKGKFAEIASKQGANALKQHWETLPRKLRHDTAYQAAYIQQLIDQGMHSDAQQCLLEWQKREVEPLFIPLMKQLNLANPAPLIKALEGWIKRDDKNAALYSTLGHVAFHAGDDVLAEKALLKSVKLSEDKTDLMLLSELSERRQDNAQALMFYKQGMNLQ